MFLTFEANEGAGKSTQAKLLADRLRAEGYDVVQTREPGGSPGAEEIRALILQGDTDRWSAMTELLLFTAARRDHIERVLQPAIDAGKIVVCDRYVGSTYALQGAGGMDTRKIDILFEEFCGLRPDMTVFLDIDPEASLRRGMARLEAAGSLENRMEAKGLEYHKKVSELFTQQYHKNDEWVRFDADGTIEDIHEEIYRTVMAHPVMTGGRLSA